ncbi:MAG: hypothetical protein P8N51_16655 [Pseudomonadales bacterium]|nr:hypothetical protein [Pseudomonadales bacterium]MDG1443619.1 hypothetical protein [Pseudomonadales bacterium]
MTDDTDDIKGTPALDPVISDSVELRLARQIRELDREMMPERDLWTAIERNIADYPQRKPFNLQGDWMPYGVAASLIIAIAALLVNVVGLEQRNSTLLAADYAIDSIDSGYVNVRNPMVDQFRETNKNLDQATLDDLYRNIEIMAQARKDIEMQVRANPENTKLVEMLMRVHERELELLKQDYSQPGRSL